MDSDRKYRQNGYYDSERSSNGNGHSDRPFKPNGQGPKPPLDITGPRLPRLVQAVTASRCYSCSTTLVAGTSFNSPCPKCGVALHCCKQCAHFEPSTRFQCLKPIPVRLPIKDQLNECAVFSPRVTVARDSVSPMPPPGLSRRRSTPLRPRAPAMLAARLTACLRKRTRRSHHNHTDFHGVNSRLFAARSSFAPRHES